MGRKADDAGVEDRGCRRFSVVSLRVEGKVDHHDGVLFDDADQHEQTDEAIDVELLSEQSQCQQARQTRRKANRRES